MKIAIALRTCSSVFNYWGGSDRVVDADKSTIVLTCLKSILKSIEQSKYEIVFSIHDDNSDQETIDAMKRLCEQFDVEFYQTPKHGNFISQYEWVKKQDCDYVYCVEDDYLHYPTAIDDMVNMCERMRVFLPSEYAVYPFNNPHRYASFDMLYTSYILKGDKSYWRSSLHSTHTFFVSKKTFDEYDNIMKFQAYQWPSLECVEDKTINTIWHEQRVKLLCPINSLAIHLADKTQEEDGWKDLWDNVTKG